MGYSTFMPMSTRHQCLTLSEKFYSADMIHPGRALSAFAHFGQHANLCIIKHATWLFTESMQVILHQSVCYKELQLVQQSIGLLQDTKQQQRSHSQQQSLLAVP
jgi:hypothetical protein